MYKHNRNRPHETRIPVGLPLDVEDAGEYLTLRLGRKMYLRIVDVDEQARRRKAMTATDEDLE
ncbi:hypothetical protein PF628_gp23 [Klebsiella phage VLCpiS11a]|uniref:hypothetical protein n=1 Tax=Klebsiella phage VLCpiS11a TaxID=2874884 RepID=UPI0022DCDFAA|nr:hypothetical protein PF628_gp23 [Klebsiella phage VLCpiS11a]UVX30679.1 hypothetical protein S11a_00023 [Klebsiella phage VLCpiS11a]